MGKLLEGGEGKGKGGKGLKNGQAIHHQQQRKGKKNKKLQGQ